MGSFVAVIAPVRGAIRMGLMGLLAGVLMVPTPPSRAAGVKAAPGRLDVACDLLADRLAGLGDMRIIKLESVGAGTLKIGATPVGEHCRLTAAIHERQGANGVPYAIGFEMRLPKDWNGRFWYQANGGIDGSVKEASGDAGGGPLTSALAQGFVVVSSDAGHENRLTRGPGFGYDPQARLDYGYQTVGSLTPLAKEVIRRAYGRAPDTSYIGGCSNGGRHAMVAASRYPEQFDGYLIGAPGFRLPLAAIANIFGAQQYAKVATDRADLSTAFTDAERRTVADAVLAKCDALDGLADGMIMASRQCQASFDLDKDVPTCQAARDGSCLSTAQKQAIGAVFAGARTSDGKPFYAPFPFDAGVAGSGVKRWEFEAPLKLDSGAVAMIFAVPPVDPKGFDGAKFVLGTPVESMLASVAASNESFRESALSFMMPVEPDKLSSAFERGARIIAYHGNSDAIFSVADSMAWIDGLHANHGGQAGGFARLFPVPGMDHCRGGPSADQFDMITPLVRWVEQGDAPASIVASVRGPGNPGGENPEVPASWSPSRTRLLCPHPQVAVYDGRGDPEQASSFSCR
ncbi:MAG: tannase/feruloyl esterase family alpha/beta hydrolase [Burkholderiaceae bacterium]